MLESLDRNLPILLIDQQPTMRAVLKNILRKLGFNCIEEADSAAVAIEKLNDAEFKFIIADWNVQDMPADELLMQLRDHQKYSDIPVLLVSNESQKCKVKECADKDRASMIVKPFTADILGQKMEEALAIKQT